MIQNLIFGILFLKISFWAYNFFIFVHRSQWTLSESFFISDSLAEKVSKPTKTSKKDHLFYNTVSLIKPHSFYEPQLTLPYDPTTQPKTFLTLQIFQQTFLCLVSEKTFALHYFLTPKNCILEALLQMSVYVCISRRVPV